MRADMEKVIVERPRWASDWPNRKFHAALPVVESDYEDETKFAPSGRCRQSPQRGSTDLLGPLRRFLHTETLGGHGTRYLVRLSNRQTTQAAGVSLVKSRPD